MRARRHPASTPSPARPALLAPLLTLTLFAALGPVSLAPYASAAPQQDCLTLSERDDVERSALEECIALHPDDVGVLAELARRDESIDGGRAEALYRRALARDPAYADLRLALGRLLLRKGAAAEARTEAERALRIQPNRRALLDLLHGACDAGAC